MKTIKFNDLMVFSLVELLIFAELQLLKQYFSKPGDHTYIA